MNFHFQRCKDSYQYFFDNYIKKSIPSRNPPLDIILTEAQKEVFCHLHTPEKPMTLFIKSRQMGYTTVVLSYCVWRAIFYNETPVLVVTFGQSDYWYKVREMLSILPNEWKGDGENIKIFRWEDFIIRRGKGFKYDKLIIEEVHTYASSPSRHKEREKEIETVIFEDMLAGKGVFIGMTAGACDFLQELSNFGTRDVGVFSIFVTHCNAIKAGLVKNLKNIQSYLQPKDFQREYMCEVLCDD